MLFYILIWLIIAIPGNNDLALFKSLDATKLNGKLIVDFCTARPSDKFEISKIVGEKAGDAMIVKLCRSIYMKGLAALTIEMTKVCEAYGVKEQVWASLAKSMDHDQFMIYTPRLIDGTIRNLERRINEVCECIDLIKSIEETGVMTEATLKLYKSLRNN